MIDRDRVLTKLDELRGYLDEIRQVVPNTFANYSNSIEKKRACERLLQISIECVLDVCSLLVSGLRLGLPSCEEDVLQKLAAPKTLSPSIIDRVKGMRALRNILIHRYGRVDDKIVFDVLSNKLDDFKIFSGEILKVLAGTGG